MDVMVMLRDNQAKILANDIREVVRLAEIAHLTESDQARRLRQLAEAIWKEGRK